MRALLVLSLTVLAISPLSAGVIAYTSYSGWAAAAAGTPTAVTFAAAPGGAYPGGYTEDGVLFQGLSAGPWNGTLYVIGVGYCAATQCLQGPPTEAGVLGTTDGYLRSTLPSPVSAVAFDIGTYISPGHPFRIHFSSGDVYNGPPLLGTTTFYGFISDTPITYVDYHVNDAGNGGDFTVMDTFYFVDTPEPASALLLGAGLLLLAARRRRRPVQ